MRFYDRAAEIAEIKRIQKLSFDDHSRMTVITGRRRIGKTSLITHALEDKNTVYLFVGRKSEATLCAEFIPEISKKLNVFIPGEIRTFRSLFQYLMELAADRAFNLVIDEFQEFYNVNASVYSDIQNIWDQYRNKSHVNFVVSGSIYSLMQKIFTDAKEALFGRADNIIKLAPFGTVTLKEIVRDFRPDYSNDDLLALYAFTGGVPKYVELFCDNGTLDVAGMIAFMVRENSPFTEEGKHLLVEEFGKNYATYFSILGAISGGINTQSEIESVIGDRSIGGQIKRLLDDYNIIERQRPILSKKGTHAVRYDIKDDFLRFWFNYFDRYRSMIEIKNYPALREIITENYNVYSGKVLERYFRHVLAESREYREIGAWWEPKGPQHEIDIVALRAKGKQAVAIEVKRSEKNFRRSALDEKIQHLKQKVLLGYEIEARCMSLGDM
jgi:AAA+ ATPase superfamily predicted ATPase